MTAKLLIYQAFINRLCDADKRATHAEEIEAAMQAQQGEKHGHQ